jgi:hypothetical protein
LDIMRMLKQVQSAQTHAQELQREMESARHEGSAGGGMVKAVVTGLGELRSVAIDPEVVNADDIELLQDLVVSAVRSAQEAATADRDRRVGELTMGLAGLNIPGLGPQP